MAVCKLPASEAQRSSFQALRCFQNLPTIDVACVQDNFMDRHAGYPVYGCRYITALRSQFSYQVKPSAVTLNRSSRKPVPKTSAPLYAVAVMRAHREAGSRIEVSIKEVSCCNYRLTSPA